MGVVPHLRRVYVSLGVCSGKLGMFSMIFCSPCNLRATVMYDIEHKLT